ncbi:hypothetical protein H8356DRAFT_1269776 [Neocallimastix lanati (nom. inval.)]|uniref:Uncharacterized protein n=1 Tax=Neocallimastix californiae TaxID=1754190 RepID=A0A1Y2BC73_9FUNG|nr:hypothetical protein H8356DRAFT_1269776 [Neocallimastix sp. JGI-2020a]ORY31685.1 hypothetical protein LY90DRAFT_512394 [Neocallimastix californiae]|eukprot:ORY31685.1 hypothetical protein LY90DRAFT_512394 [Neocallimastix californiae]
MLKRDIRIFINSDGPIEYTLEYFANSNDEKKFYGDVIFFVRNSNDLLCSFSKSLEKVRCFSKDCTYITLNFAEITDLITENKNLNRTIIENNKFVCGVYIQLYKDIECKDL